MAAASTYVYARGKVRGAAAAMAMATAPRGIRTWRRNLERLRAARGERARAAGQAAETWAGEMTTVPSLVYNLHYLSSSSHAITVTTLLSCKFSLPPLPLLCNATYLLISNIIHDVLLHGPTGHFFTAVGGSSSLWLTPPPVRRLLPHVLLRFLDTQGHLASA
jgi:hypothetical protein